MKRFYTYIARGLIATMAVAVSFLATTTLATAGESRCKGLPMLPVGADRQPVAVLALRNGNYRSTCNPNNYGLQCDWYGRDPSTNKPGGMRFLIQQLDTFYEKGFRRIMLFLPAGVPFGQEFWPSSQWHTLDDDTSLDPPLMGLDPACGQDTQDNCTYTQSPPPRSESGSIKQDLADKLTPWLRNHPDTRLIAYMGFMLNNDDEHPLDCGTTPYTRITDDTRGDHGVPINLLPPDVNDPDRLCVLHENTDGWRALSPDPSNPQIHFGFDYSGPYPENLIQVAEYFSQHDIWVLGEGLPRDFERVLDEECALHAPWHALKIYFESSFIMKRDEQGNPIQKISADHYVAPPDTHVGFAVRSPECRLDANGKCTIPVSPEDAADALRWAFNRGLVSYTVVRAESPLHDNALQLYANHFLCYGTRPTRGSARFDPNEVGPLQLNDWLESKQFELKRPRTLCVPVDMNAQGIVDPQTHRRGFAIKSPRGEPRFGRQIGIRVENELAPLYRQTRIITVDIGEANRLLAPSTAAKDAAVPPPSTNPHGLVGVDFKCYPAKISRGTPGIAADTQVVLKDWLNQPIRYNVIRPTRLCTPIPSAGNTIEAGSRSGLRDNHLMCYAISRARGEPSPTRVKGIAVRDRFGPEGQQVNTTRVEELCIQSRVLPAPGDVDLNGYVDSQDIDDFTNVLLAPDNASLYAFLAADVNQDGYVNSQDIQPLLDILNGSGSG